jgi:Protein of unknown function (DUF3489)
VLRLQRQGQFQRQHRAKPSPAIATSKAPPASEQTKVERVTKQERVLTLLSQPKGASNEEMMQATNWRARVSGGHGEKEARLPADIVEGQ